jgi:NAD(P)-dependent dehydrogenase (short-subunit alcohol dehydrogenase family)/acyl dehydratase
MPPNPDGYQVSDLHVGMSAQFERDIDEGDVLEFARNSGDYNPLHIDAAYAAQTNFGARIVHGAFQVGLASAMVGMHLPGKSSLLTLFNAQFPAPLKFPSRVRVRGELVSWNPESITGRLRVTIIDVSKNTLTADIGVGFSLHQSREGHKEPSHPPAMHDRQGGRPLVLVTGAAGGIGSEIVRGLLGSHSVVALCNRSPLPENLRDMEHLRVIHAGLSDPQWPGVLADAIGDETLYGAIHCAWPGMPKGGLLSLPSDSIQAQLSFGTLHLIELARLLAAKAPQTGARLIALGSTAGRLRPVLNVAAYSLAKGAMEQTVRLLAAELAIKKITVNAISPSFVPAGINQQADDRQRKIESAQVPMGRLCQTDDIVAAVEFLLSPGASFVSGQVLGLAGAQL